MYQVVYNPLSGNGQGYDRVLTLRDILKNEEISFLNILDISDFRSFFDGIREEDSLVIAGGDGTLNRFLNSTDGLELPKHLYYFAIGSGNDFRHDVACDETGLIALNEYVKNLPTVTVKGKTYRFLNGVGYGIDGYCCEVGDKISKNKKDNKPINYAGIAIKGLLFHYKPTHAKVTVDGEIHEFDKVWLAPTMNGRFYGGGMMISPAQDRLTEEKLLSVVVMHSSGKLKTLAVFPSIFKGGHINHKEMITVLTGKEIKVEFDRPVALQIDGETILAVTEYSAKVYSHALAEKI